MAGAVDASFVGTVRLSVEIRFGALVAWRTVIVHADVAIHGVLYARFHALPWSQFWVSCIVLLQFHVRVR